MKTKTIIILILLLLAVVFIIQNSAMVTIKLFFWSISMNRIIMIGGLMLVGFAIGYLLAAAKTAKTPGSTAPPAPKITD